VSPVETSHDFTRGYGQLVVQLTPLLNFDADPLDPETFLTPTQFSDVVVTHPFNEARTASVALPMDDPVVASLEPYEQALRVLYYRPGDDGYEVIFWGQTNVEDDYATGKVTLTAQDPSIRMQHHYARIGDDVMNDPSDPQKGTITPDYFGIAGLVQCAVPPSGPALGCIVNDINADEHALIPMGIERGQEVWSLIQDIVTNDLGPNIDMRPAQGLDEGTYCFLDTYADNPRDVTSEVTFSYGFSDDNATNVTVSPGHPTTHAHVIDTKKKWRATAAAPEEIAATGAFVDWIATDHEVKHGDTGVLEEAGRAHVRAYARPPKQTEVTLRPDNYQDHFYGHPTQSGNGDTQGDFYTGDLIRVRAQRGSRSINEKYLITQVELSAPGPRGPVQTNLSVVPRPRPIEVFVGVAET
jgi:hypothetical protein